ncbi:MAG: hypothetical protein NTX50_08655, partial [Candidatus Sumerlaeota bacterium]|nr:hypothetical protein [Candidatus Sumerlaeota bacterium]
AQLDPSLFTPRWAGFATAMQPYRMRQGQRDYHQIIQRTGERADEYQYKAFLATRPGGEAEALTQHYEDLPAILARDHIDPHVPWLYNFKLDFRFR